MEGEATYRQLRARLASGYFRPNQALREAGLAASLGVSRTPVREALLRLQGEGLVEYEPRLGARVPDLTASDLEELFSTRLALESLALRYACKAGHRPGRLTHLRRKCAEGFQAAQAGDAERLLDINTEFHADLVRLSGKPRLVSLIENLRDISRRYRAVVLYDEEEQLQSVQEHLRFLEYVEASDPEPASHLLATHLNRPYTRLAPFLAIATGCSASLSTIAVHDRKHVRR